MELPLYVYVVLNLDDPHINHEGCRANVEEIFISEDSAFAYFNERNNEQMALGQAPSLVIQTRVITK